LRFSGPKRTDCPVTMGDKKNTSREIVPGLWHSLFEGDSKRKRLKRDGEAGEKGDCLAEFLLKVNRQEKEEVPTTKYSGTRGSSGRGECF